MLSWLAASLMVRLELSRVASALAAALVLRSEPGRAKRKPGERLEGRGRHLHLTMMPRNRAGLMLRDAALRTAPQHEAEEKAPSKPGVGHIGRSRRPHASRRRAVARLLSMR